MKKFIATMCLAVMLIGSLSVAFAAEDVEPSPPTNGTVTIAPMWYDVPPQPIIKN